MDIHAYNCVELMPNSVHPHPLPITPLIPVVPSVYHSLPYNVTDSSQEYIRDGPRPYMCSQSTWELIPKDAAQTKPNLIDFT